MFEKIRCLMFEDGDIRYFIERLTPTWYC